VHNAALSESVGDEGSERIADVVTYHQIGEIVEIGRLTIDDDERRAGALRRQRKPRRRPHDQLRADSEKKAAIPG
jgi:hypothetical protein